MQGGPFLSGIRTCSEMDVKVVKHVISLTRFLGMTVVPSRGVQKTEVNQCGWSRVVG